MAGLIELITTAFTDIVAWVTESFEAGLRSGYETISVSMFGTSTPVTAGGFVLGPPTNDPWIALHESLVAGEITVVALLLLVVCVQGRHAVRAAGFGSPLRAERVRRSAWIGGVLIVTWYWLAAGGLYLVDAFTLALLPRLETVLELVGGLASGPIANPVLALGFAAVGGIAMWLVQALFLVRQLLLPIAVYVMPVVLAVAYGGVPVVSQIAERFAVRFLPLAVAPLPAALLLRGYELGVTAGILDFSGPFARKLVAVSLPVLVLWTTWRVFTFTSPTATRIVGGSVRGAALLGTAGAATAVAGSTVGLTAARFGPRAAVGQAAIGRIADRSESDQTASFRRTERDPPEDGR